MRIFTKNAGETRKAAALLAGEVFKVLRLNVLPNALVISLEGNLGAGKTTFAQGFAKALGVKEKVASPTFVVLKRYAIPFGKKSGRSKNAASPYALYHIDGYRVNSEDLLAIGFADIANDPGAVILVEWGDRVRRILPKPRVTIRFSHLKRNARRMEISTLF